MFGSRLLSSLAQAGHETEMIGSEPALRERLAAVHEGERAVLVADLTDDRLDGAAILESLRAENLLGSLRTLAFFSHVESDVRTVPEGGLRPGRPTLSHGARSTGGDRGPRRRLSAPAEAPGGAQDAACRASRSTRGCSGEAPGPGRPTASLTSTRAPQASQIRWSSTAPPQPRCSISTGGPAGGRRIAVAPLHQRDDRRPEVQALLGQAVFVAGRALLVEPLLDDALLLQAGQAGLQDVAGDPQMSLELVESPQSQHHVADDQQRPALAHDLERPGDAAGLVGVVVVGAHRHHNAIELRDATLSC